MGIRLCLVWGYGTEGKKALELAEQRGALTVYAVVDALTRLSQDAAYAGLRVEADQKASALLALAA